MNRVVDSVVELIGGTAALRLGRLVGSWGLRGTIVAKLEYLNPGFSKKDRVALAMVRATREEGALRPGQTVVELTSGNTGTGLAIVCRALGHPFIAVMSKGNTPERAHMMAALGAEVVLVDQCPGSLIGQVSGADLARVDARAKQIIARLGAFRADQFTLPANLTAHEQGTAAELWAQCEGQLDAFVDFLGSGGTFGGCARYLRPRGVRCFAVEPEGAAPYAGQAVTAPGHAIQGGGYSRELPLVDPGDIDGCLQVSSTQAAEEARALAREEGVFAGFSSGANLAAARQLLAREPGLRIGLLINDCGLKYLSTDLY